MKYEPLFEISIVHPYYEDGRCPDIRVVASAESDALLRQHRAIVKGRPQGVLVVVPVNDEGTLHLPFPDGAAVSFDVRVTGEDFHLVTDRTAMPPMKVDIAGLSALAPSASPASYAVTFTARPARWVYYVVTDVPKGTGTGDLTIVDMGASPLVFGDANKRDLVAAPDESDPVARRLAALYPDKRRLRFVSDAAVPAREASRKYVELRVDGSMVREHLPNPSIRAFSRIGVGDPAAAMDVVYTVIEHFTQSAGIPAA